MIDIDQLYHKLLRQTSFDNGWVLSQTYVYYWNNFWYDGIRLNECFLQLLQNNKPKQMSLPEV
jgi:hypothetical protein